MIKNSDWTPFQYNTSHMVNEGIQYSIINYTNFIQLDVYSWHSHTLLKRYYFFIQPLREGCHNEDVRLWNCGSQSRAVELAKEFCIMAFPNMMLSHKDDMSKYHTVQLQ